MKEVSSAPSKVVNVRGMATTAANSESEQGDHLHQRAVRYKITKCWTSGPIYLSHKLDQLKLINRLSMPKKNLGKGN